MISPQLWKKINDIQNEIQGGVDLQLPLITPFEWYPPEDLSPKSLARVIDHTLLKPEATEADLKRVCAEAKVYNFKTVCVNSSWIELVSAELKGSTTQPICVVGFPNGVCETSVKVYETEKSILLGAQEIDMVIHLGWLRQKDWQKVLEDLEAVKIASGEAPLKVILETSHLSIEEKIAATLLVRASGADFAKTCSGFAGGGATADDVSLMRAIMGPVGGVKASGGVKTWEDAVTMISAGANRIGTSSGVAIVSKDKSAGPVLY
jgi:deoxyribose-phosphate aldolase